MGQVGTTAEAGRRIAVSEQTHYRWKEYGGLKTEDGVRCGWFAQIVDATLSDSSG
jgi:hypothetical protein